jgi:hypothetical protein
MWLDRNCLGNGEDGFDRQDGEISYAYGARIPLVENLKP